MTSFSPASKLPLKKYGSDVNLIILRILKTTYFCGHVNIEQNWEPLYHFVDWAIQKRRTEGNPKPEIDKTNWDLIYVRMMNGSIKDWPALYRKIYK